MVGVQKMLRPEKCRRNEISMILVRIRLVCPATNSLRLYKNIESVLNMH